MVLYFLEGFGGLPILSINLQDILGVTFNIIINVFVYVIIAIFIYYLFIRPRTYKFDATILEKTSGGGIRTLKDNFKYATLKESGEEVIRFLRHKKIVLPSPDSELMQFSEKGRGHMFFAKFNRLTIKPISVSEVWGNNIFKIIDVDTFNIAVKDQVSIMLKHMKLDRLMQLLPIAAIVILGLFGYLSYKALNDSAGHIAGSNLEAANIYNSAIKETLPRMDKIIETNQQLHEDYAELIRRNLDVPPP